jgi:sulfatase maturation enzyme AslB (radical SAM superfamily)
MMLSTVTPLQEHVSKGETYVVCVVRVNKRNYEKLISFIDFLNDEEDDKVLKINVMDELKSENIVR